MPDTEGKTGNKNAEINDDVIIWNHRMRMVFDSSTAFDKPFSGEDVLSDFILHLA
ncbi:hypothetical protein [Spirosoma rigui]|uniref:hypothetical protein n=1 Tax=Spirosoma rigui TaxID=564064 RepID=UPI0012D2F40D|nr:hypothetical protein [Spirosoma rigui]